MRSGSFSESSNATLPDGINSPAVAPGAISCVTDVETEIHSTSLSGGDARCVGEFRTTISHHPRLREAGAKFQTPVLMG